MEKVPLNGLKRHQQEAILRGESASVGGRVYTIADFPELRIPAALAPSADMARMRELEANVQAANAKIRELEEAATRGGNVAVDLKRVEGERDLARAEATSLKDRLSEAEDKLTEVEGERDSARTEATNALAQAGQLQSRIEALESAASDPDLATKYAAATALIKELADVEREPLQRMTTEQLAAIARYRGIDAEGKNKAALVAILAPAGG